MKPITINHPTKAKRMCLTSSKSTFRIPGVLLILLALTAWTQPAVSAPLPDYWLSDWDEAKKVAQETDKPILAVFSAEWCGPCQYMKENVYTDADVISALDAWVPVYIDVDVGDNRDLADHYEIPGYPTFIMFDSSLQEEARMVGGLQSADFMYELKNRPALGRLIGEVRAELSENPEDPVLWKKLADAYVALDQEAEAVPAFEKAVYYDPKDETGAADDLFFYTSIPETEADLEASGARFATFESKFPESPFIDRVYLFRALIAYHLDEPAKAKDFAQQGLDKFPESNYSQHMGRLIEKVESEE